jgi:hypothetical protein
VWQTTAILADDEVGVNDDTHRTAGDSERMQQELIEDEHAKIFRIGFTVQEVEEILKNA